MRLPSFKRLFSSDYPKDFQSIIEKLSFIINNGIEVLYDALNNKLTFQDNFFADVIDITVTASDTMGNLKQPTQITLNKLKNNKVTGIWVVMATNQTNPNTYPTSGINISFTQNNNILTLTNITGLPVNNIFTLKVILLSI